MTGTVLILGASGRFGHNAAQAFEQAGWTVRRFDRKSDDLGQASRGVDVIVNAWNPPYPQWRAQVPGLTSQVIEAARSSGATVVVPGNVYVFGAQTPAPWSERSDYGALNPLGRIRIEMEAAYAASGVRTIVLRAGDYLDTRASGNWFDQIMVKKLRKGVFTFPGDPTMRHAWAYLPDLARATVTLAEMRHDLPVFADIPFAGYTLSGAEIAQGLSVATGRNVRLKQMSWLPVQALRPVWSLAKSLVEMRYLWNTPHMLDGTLFDQLVPDFDATDVTTALRMASRPALSEG